MSDAEQTVTIKVTPRAAVLLATLETFHAERIRDEEKAKEAERQARRAAAEKGETYHSQMPLGVGGHPNQSTPPMTKEQIASHALERGLSVFVNFVTHPSIERHPSMIAAAYPGVSPLPY
jgi:hypothetical protein